MQTETNPLPSVLTLADNHLRAIRQAQDKGVPQSYAERNFTLGIHAIPSPNIIVKEEIVAKDIDSPLGF